MKTALIAFASLLLSQASFSQTVSGENIYNPPNMVVSGLDMTEITGCWARLFEGSNFNGRLVTVVGFTTWAELTPDSWPGWSGQVKSAEVGPDATLELYGQPYFVDQDNAIASGVAVRDLPEVPVGDSVQSLKLLCNPN